MKLLHIIATPRTTASGTLPISNAFIAGLHSNYADLIVEDLDLFKQDLPAVAGDNIETKYHLMIGAPIDKTHEASWKQVEYFIQNFLSADIVLITSPMWNFGIPYALKYYIDSIVQPGYLFKFNEKGIPEGMVHGKKMVCISSRGGDYSEGMPMHAYDFQEPYLRAIFGYVGITDIEFINAQPMDIMPELRKIAVENASKQARALGENFEWS